MPVAKVPARPKLETVHAKLDPTLASDSVLAFRESLENRILGQPDAVNAVIMAYQTALAGLTSNTRPIANILLLGPTGTGKTKIAEVTSELLSGSTQFVRIDCGEFQHSHDVAKLIGSPPGYIGHRETAPRLTQEALDRQYSNSRHRLSVVLFDEIEKANDALWQLLLGILWEGRLTTGDNRTVDFSRTLIFITSNLGAAEVTRLSNGQIGFTSETPDKDHIDKISRGAADKKFSPEFMNRLDRVIVFNELTPHDLSLIFNREMAAIQDRISMASSQAQCPIFILSWNPPAKEYLLAKGTSKKYGARELRRVIEQEVVQKLSNIILTNQVDSADTITLDVEKDKLVFLHSFR